MNIILLSGGSGTRLWPLSNEVRSKQFLKIFRDNNGKHESMVQRIYRLIHEVDSNAFITIATSKSQIVSIKNQLGDDVDLSVEPCRRDTFPAIALSVAYLHNVKKISSDDSVVICPVDQLVEKAYFETLKKMYDYDGPENLCLMGIEPTYPSDKFGYIITNKESVVFKEKPNMELAKEYIKNGALWNGGVFAFKIKYILEKSLNILGTSNYFDLQKKYFDLPKISFDYAVSEHESKIKVIKYSGIWKDLGTWNTFTEVMTDTIGGNAVLGEKCKNVHVVNELSIPIVGLGLENLIVAATPDGILVSNKESSEQLKKYVPNNRPMYEKRFWGEYRVLDYQSFNDGLKALTKELIILPGKFISYQKHNHRNEIWTFTTGNGLLLLNGIVKEVKSGDSAHIKAGVLHSIKAINELHIIEVQIGDELVEEDIERFDWNWE